MKNRTEKHMGQIGQIGQKGLISLIALMSLMGCIKPKARMEHERQGTQYAQFFTLVERDTTVESRERQFTELRIYNPWEETHPVLQRYYLYKEAGTPVPEDGIAVQVPVKRIATGSCTHVGFLSALDALKQVCGVTDKHLVYTPLEEDVLNLGDCISPDVERFVAAEPEVVFMSAYSTNDVATTRLQKAGLVVVPVMEWVENDPLGRAEWVRFFGAFVDKQSEADSLFDRIADHYKGLCGQISESDEAMSRSILSGGSFRGTWYVPSGATYMGRLFHDAGASYAYAEDRTNGSIPLGIEQVLQAFRDADVWVGAPAGTLRELEEMDSKHTWFKAYQDSAVYTFKARTTPTGGNDFWEAGVTEPDRILNDLIAVLYPEKAGEGYSLKYLQKLR